MLHGNLRGRSLADWNSVQRSFSSMLVGWNRGEIRRRILLRASPVGADGHVQQFLHRNLLPLVTPEAEPAPTLALQGQARVILDSALRSLVVRRWSATGLLHWSSLFDESFQLLQWMRQQSSQASTQTFFLIGFVPAVGGFVCILNAARFIENIGTGLGQAFLLISVMLYSCGAIMARRFINSGLSLSSSTELRTPSGQLNFLSSLLCAAEFSATRRRSFLVSCQSSGRSDLAAYASHLDLGLHTEYTEGEAVPKAELVFLEQIREGYLSCVRRGISWLSERQRDSFLALKSESAARGARLSLKLLLPMAIFFLPALFLILALCGFSLVTDNLN